MCEEGRERQKEGGGYWKSWWLRLQWATSPDRVTAGDQHPSGEATEAQLWRVSHDSPGGRVETEAGRHLTTLPSSAEDLLSQQRSDHVFYSTSNQK